MNGFTGTISAALLVSVLGLTQTEGLAATKDVDIPFEALTSRALDLVILPGYGRFAETTERLSGVTRSFCSDPTTQGFQNLTMAFHEAWDSWAGIQYIGFGPVSFLDRSFRIQYWPDRRNSVGKELSALLANPAPEKLADTAFRETTVAVQGFPASERLMFGKEAAGFLEPSTREAHCAVALAITTNLAGMSGDILEDWTEAGGFAKAMQTAGRGSIAYETKEGSTADLMKSILVGLEVIGELKLSRPLGKSVDRPRSKRAEAWRSKRSLRNVRIAAAAMLKLYNLEGDGFGSTLAESGHPELDAQIHREFDALLDDLNGIEGTLADAVGDGVERPKVIAAIETTRRLRTLFAQGVASAFGLVVGFNSLDGD